VYGVDAVSVIATFEAYEYETSHAFLTKTLAADWVILGLSSCVPLALHWGDIARLNDHMDQSLVHIRRMIDEPDRGPELSGLLCGPVFWTMFVWSCRMSAERREALATILVSCELSWSQADATLDSAVNKVVWLRERGNRTLDTGAYDSVETHSAAAKCGYLLMTSDFPRVPDEEIFKALPSVDEIIASTTMSTGYHVNASVMFINTYLSCAAVCEKLGRHDDVLKYAVAGLTPCFDKARTTLPFVRVLLQSIQARALAALGRKAEAGASFEGAAHEARRCGLFLFEAFALRDLKVCVLDETCHAEQASRRLGA
jgi:hypothetical protein